MGSSKISAFLLIFMIFFSSSPVFGCGSCPPKKRKHHNAPKVPSPLVKPPATNPPLHHPPVIVPPVHRPPFTLPPVYRPPITVPPIRRPPVYRPPVTVPPVYRPPVTLPPIYQPPVTVPPVIVPPVVQPPVTVPPVIVPPVILPPVLPAPVKGTPPCPSPPPLTPSSPTCPADSLKLGACVDLLGGLVHIGLGDPVANQCCPILQGLVELEAAVCLCTTLKLKLLNIQIFLPIALQLLATCGKAPPAGYTCTI